MGDEQRLDRLLRRKENHLPQTRKGMAIAAKIAVIHERMKGNAGSQEPHFAGIEVFTAADTARKIVDLPSPSVPRPMEVVPAPVLPEFIENFDDPRVGVYKERILKELGDPAMSDISEVTKQALRDAPFSPEFRKTMGAFVAVQKHYVGKGPMYRGESLTV